MALIEWDDDLYSVGIKAMDEEHKVLIGLINALHEKKSTADKEFIESILDTLVHYTKNHFVHEEKILKKIGYQAFDHHKDTHHDFEVAINEAIQDYKDNGDNEKTIDKLIDFLKNWIRHHILVEDKAYGEYLTS